MSQWVCDVPRHTGHCNVISRSSGSSKIHFQVLRALCHAISITRNLAFSILHVFYCGAIYVSWFCCCDTKWKFWIFALYACWEMHNISLRNINLSLRWRGVILMLSIVLLHQQKPSFQSQATRWNSSNYSPQKLHHPVDAGLNETLHNRFWFLIQLRMTTVYGVT